jgi:hypothetical protein
MEPLPNSEVHNDETYGALKLTLRPKGYEWRFLSAVGGEFTDSGSRSSPSVRHGEWSGDSIRNIG